jgi:hypothetical protein
MRRMEEAGILIRRAQPFEITRVRSFAEENFSVAWADEMSRRICQQAGVDIYRGS